MGERIGVLGGTFDPPHLGHLIVASEARWRLRLDRVLLVPAGVPPHKPEGPSMPAHLRGALVERAVRDEAGLELSRVELDRRGKAYTADTLEGLAREHPGADLWFILGADQLTALPSWRAPERILAAARLAAAPRAGWARDRAERGVGEIATGRVDWLDIPEIGISSSLVRERLAAGRPVRWLVPPAVEDALVEAGLVPS